MRGFVEIRARLNSPAGDSTPQAVRRDPTLEVALQTTLGATIIRVISGPEMNEPAHSVASFNFQL